ncbi:PQQ-binding-like beta-propeller repeat protein [Mycolicibacterium septicum DSM 44393]|uniref:PQQ-binding-like beta-propeller repeat protein n=1 Tax=Mycolicibacterium septicum DSM 44393 TaxID=1341646 RepID=A0A7X6MNU1_9MYCO|nr:PQQ-binding-like beta-propeller repeat protein [Mycolicibacterium septicum]NKZ12165.1 PQQ-binding-like beta-propeller repeat protein [Mycolicibacterium septicum DSM 44393]
MSSDQNIPSDGTTPSRIGSFSAGAAVVWFVSAIALAIWSRLDAKFGVVGDPPRPPKVDQHPWNSAAFLSVSAAIVAALLLLALLRTRRARRSGQPHRWATVGVLAVVALVFLAAFSTGALGYFRDVMREGPITASLPAAVGAWALTVAGAVAAVFAAFGLPWWTRRVAPMLGAGVVVAVVASAAVTVAAGFAGNDGRFIDATTANQVDVPPYPIALGQHKFTVKLPAARPAFDERNYEIWPAGPGFVVSYAGAVTAYGADGNERWHYRRTGPAESTMSARVYDQGATVVVADFGAAPARSQRAESVLVGIDAITGQHLWTRRDARLTSAFLAKSGLYDADPFLVDRTDETWTRFDARTGEAMWSVTNPRGDCSEQRAADTGNRLTSLLWCERETEGHRVVDHRILAADPRNGEKLWEFTYLPDVSLDDESWRDFSIYPFPTGSAGIYLEVSANDPQRATDYYVDPGKKLIVPLPADVDALTTPAPAEDFLVRHKRNPPTRDSVLSVYGSDGKPRCNTTTPIYPGGRLLPNRRESRVGYVALRDGFVLSDFSRDVSHDPNGPSFLRMFSNTTCQPVAEVPFDASLGLVAAPGVLLALRQDVPDMETVVIEGYA